MNVLMWDKPAKIMTEEERAAAYQADGAPPGVYVPNMSDEDRRRWKAKKIGGDHPRVEIRKDTFVVIVSLGGGYHYKHYKPKQTEGVNIHIAAAGPIMLTFEEWAEFQQAVQEAREALETVECKSV